MFRTSIVEPASLSCGQKVMTCHDGNQGGELLIMTGDIVGWWIEYFEGLLKPSDVPSVEEAELDNQGEALLISLAQGVVQLDFWCNTAYIAIAL